MITDSPVTGSGLTPFIDSRTPLFVRSNGKRAMTQRMRPQRKWEDDPAGNEPVQREWVKRPPVVPGIARAGPRKEREK
ncbi:hypothetical protein GCM10009730_04110 [Streptomyces albidochromogenes]